MGMCVFHLESEIHPYDTNEVFGISHLQQKPILPFLISQWHEHVYACVEPSYFKPCCELVFLLKMNSCKSSSSLGDH